MGLSGQLHPYRALDSSFFYPLWLWSYGEWYSQWPVFTRAGAQCLEVTLASLCRGQT